jgi:type I restriction enzyme S subunit
MKNLLISMAKGSAQPNLSPVETGEIEITIPTREILDKLNEVINPMYEKLIKLKVENQKLAELRDLLLPKLMSGEIRV